MERRDAVLLFIMGIAVALMIDKGEIKAKRGHETNKKTRRPLIVCQPGD